MAVAGWGGRWQQHARAWPAADGRDVVAGSSSWRWSPEFAVFWSGVSAVLPMHNKQQTIKTLNNLEVMGSIVQISI
jgi:hypothetical protein